MDITDFAKENPEKSRRTKASRVVKISKKGKNVLDILSAIEYNSTKHISGMAMCFLRNRVISACLGGRNPGLPCMFTFHKHNANTHKQNKFLRRTKKDEQNQKQSFVTDPGFRHDRV